MPRLTDTELSQYHITVVIPAYNVAQQVGSVLLSFPGYIRQIIVVNDGSQDATAEEVMKVAKEDARILLINHEHNQGVGGAMITGFRKALELDSQVVVKVDGDGQMCTDYIPDLITPLILGQCDFTKGNRFRDLKALSQMPVIRRIGNTALSFLAKAATGYWNCFDPTNGFLAIRGDILRQMPFEKIHKTFFFETSVLSHLYLLGAHVGDIPIPARYKGEKSNLSIWWVLVEFPIKLIAVFFRRLILKYFLYDFSMASIYLMTGVPLLLFGLIYGFYKWVYYACEKIAAPTGNIMLAVLSIVIGFQVLLSATAIDLQNSPGEPICSGPLEIYDTHGRGK